MLTLPGSFGNLPQRNSISVTFNETYSILFIVGINKNVVYQMNVKMYSFLTESSNCADV